MPPSGEAVAMETIPLFAASTSVPQRRRYTGRFRKTENPVQLQFIQGHIQLHIHMQFIQLAQARVGHKCRYRREEAGCHGDGIRGFLPRFRCLP
ncbi:hypothetical protein CDAR_583671 [Caerostris darwini]|uniref:Uncharacterized protein n=1 Tax=Caerostris darwini TaxID=1538125 RepID=A0AAV4QVS9_9ARAC|nr:hypothetical protein CDAR_583671 [Caerostris darwini]